MIVSAVQRKSGFNNSAMAAAMLISIMAISGCQSNPFKREPVPEPRYVPTIILGDSETLSILASRVPCTSALPMQCMLAKTQESGEIFQIPYDWIEGFEAKPGREYVLRVRPQIDEAQQRRTGHWTLQTIVSERMVSRP